MCWPNVSFRSIWFHQCLLQVIQNTMLADLQLDIEEILAVYLLWELLSFVPSVTNEQQKHLGFLHFFIPSKSLFDLRLTEGM